MAGTFIAGMLIGAGAMLLTVYLAYLYATRDSAQFRKDVEEYLDSVRTTYYKMGYSEGLRLFGEATMEEKLAFVANATRIDGILRGKSFDDLTAEENEELIKLTAQIKQYEDKYVKMPLPA